ncbi:hypothetical protein KY285_033632 [Solanum tuberosum]|nr:hypothetical protein KY285_033632 [Solanum tuberosum]
MSRVMQACGVAWTIRYQVRYTMICIGMRNLAGKQHLPTLQKTIICPETSVKRKAESIGGSLKLIPTFT